MAVIYMERERLQKLTTEKVTKLVNANRDDLRLKKLLDYYEGKHAILNEHRSASRSANNRIVCNGAKYITNTATGFFNGKPVTYDSENETLLEYINGVFEYNDEQDENAELAKKCSIYGYCFEMLWYDEDGEQRFTFVEPKNGIMIYETGTNTPICFIRHFDSLNDNDEPIIKVEKWTYEECVKYIGSPGGTLVVQECIPNARDDIPFVEYVNNEERIGDYEGEISLMDAYNRIQSNTANLFQYNDDALLKISKLGDVQETDVKEMLENGCVILDDGGDVDWIIKEVNDAALENHKKRLREDIQLYSSVPLLTDEAFGGNLSGVAIAYKLWGLEQIRAIKERKFKKGLQRRIELLVRFGNMVNFRNDTYTDVKMTFRANMPQNLTELAQIAGALASDVSRETRLQLLPFVEDAQAEIEKLHEEQEQERNGYDDYSGAFRHADETDSAVTEDE